MLIENENYVQKARQNIVLFFKQKNLLNEKPKMIYCAEVRQVQEDTDGFGIDYGT